MASKTKKEAVSQVAPVVVPQVTPVIDGWGTVFKKPNEETPEAETTPAPKPKKEIFTTPVAKHMGSRKEKADNKIPSEKKTFIIEDEVMEKIYLLKYYSHVPYLSTIINDALKDKISKYEAEHGILYRPTNNEPYK